MQTLVRAWHAIRSNGETSGTLKTRESAKRFGADLPRNLRKIQDRLRSGYDFSPAYGATPPKGKGRTGKRGIVVAPIEDRIVQRAILDVLQSENASEGFKSVLGTPTSIGGIPGRGVEHGIQLFDEGVKRGLKHIAGSDIANFFTNIPRQQVVDFVASEVNETEFISLFQNAIGVELKNYASLSDEDRKLFPTGPDGVAQGSPLSALAGNIALREFDVEMNREDRGLLCIRYIDDFLLMGRKEAAVTKGLRKAGDLLGSMGMEIYDADANPEKAFIGLVSDHHVFLGYELEPGRYPPAASGMKKLKANVEQVVAEGKKSLSKALAGRDLNRSDRTYAQTIIALNNVVRGWRGSYRASECDDVFAELDRWVTERTRDFNFFFWRKFKDLPPDEWRHALGVDLMKRGE